MKYKVGDRVVIKGENWYNSKKDATGTVNTSRECFVSDMAIYCGKTLTISSCNDIDGDYAMEEDHENWAWVDEMIEGLEDNLKINNQETLETIKTPIPEGYEFAGLDIDENGKVYVIFEKSKS